MYCESIRQLTLSLHLDTAPVGVRFLFLPEEVEACTAAPVPHPKSCCALISDGAKRGLRQKADAGHVSCPGALTALAMALCLGEIMRSTGGSLWLLPALAGLLGAALREIFGK